MMIPKTGDFVRLKMPDGRALYVGCVVEVEAETWFFTVWVHVRWLDRLGRALLTQKYRPESLVKMRSCPVELLAALEPELED